MFEPYQMNESFTVAERTRCTLDFFADVELFTKRFGHFVVEAGFASTAFFDGLPSSADAAPAGAELARELRQLPDLEPPGSEEEASQLPSGDNLAALRGFRKRLEEGPRLGGAAVLRVGRGEVVELRDLVRRRLASGPV